MSYCIYCGTKIVYIDEYQQWWCDSCRKYIEPIQKYFKEPIKKAVPEQSTVKKDTNDTSKKPVQIVTVKKPKEKILNIYQGQNTDMFLTTQRFIIAHIPIHHSGVAIGWFAGGIIGGAIGSAYDSYRTEQKRAELYQASPEHILSDDSKNFEILFTDINQILIEIAPPNRLENKIQFITINGKRDFVLPKKIDIDGFVSKIESILQNKILIKDLDPNHRIKTIAHYEQLGYEMGLEYCVLALNDPNQEVKMRAGLALERFGKPSVDPLIHALGNPDPNVRNIAAKTLGNIGDKRAVKPLVRAMEDNNIFVQRNAAESVLHKIKNPTLRTIKHALKVNNSEVRLMAVEAIEKRDDEKALKQLVKALTDENRTIRNRAVQILEQKGVLALEPLISGLRSQEPELKCGVAKILGNIRDMNASIHLIRTLQDNEPKVRRAVAKALGKIGDPRAIKYLEHSTNDNNWLVRMTVKSSLRKLQKNYMQSYCKQSGYLNSSS